MLETSPRALAFPGAGRAPSATQLSPPLDAAPLLFFEFFLLLDAGAGLSLPEPDPLSEVLEPEEPGLDEVPESDDEPESEDVAAGTLELDEPPRLSVL